MGSQLRTSRYNRTLIASGALGCLFTAIASSSYKLCTRSTKTVNGISPAGLRSVAGGGGQISCIGRIRSVSLQRRTAGPHSEPAAVPAAARCVSALQPWMCMSHFLQVWDLSTCSVVFEVGVKSVTKESWPLLHWCHGDEGVYHGVTNTVHQYSRADGFKGKGCTHCLSPQPLQPAVMFLPSQRCPVCQ